MSVSTSIQRQSQARSPGLWPLGKEEPVTDVEVPVELINAIKMDFNRVWHRSAAGSLEGTRAHEANVRQLEVDNSSLDHHIVLMRDKHNWQLAGLKTLLDSEPLTKEQTEVFHGHVEAALATADLAKIRGTHDENKEAVTKLDITICKTPLNEHHMSPPGTVLLTARAASLIDLTEVEEEPRMEYFTREAWVEFALRAERNADAAWLFVSHGLRPVWREQRLTSLRGTWDSSHDSGNSRCNDHGAFETLLHTEAWRETQTFNQQYYAFIRKPLSERTRQLTQASGKPEREGGRMADS